MPRAEPFGPRVRSVLTQELGRALPPFVDHHVHLEMIDPAHLAAGGLGGVVDLGANPAAIADLAARLGVPHVRFAGAFLTAPGGYPADREWLRPGSLREIAAASPREGTAALPDAVASAVAEQHSFGASVVKVVLNSDAGPVFDGETLDAIVSAARAIGLPVAVHAEGAGTAERAIDAGADALVHTPWTERLPDALIARAARGQAWISTLDIHARDGASGPGGFETAIDNLARFHAAGGRVLYGTDLGNGDLPAGVNPRELAALARAGLGPAAVLAALTDPWPDVPRTGGPRSPGAIATFVPGEPPAAPEDLPAWLATARVVPAEDLEEIP